MLSMTVLTDGRQEYLEKSLPTWLAAYDDQLGAAVIIDDSGDTGYRHWLIETFPSCVVVAVGKDRCGYSQAMREVFGVVRYINPKYNLHVEDDFILHRPPNLDDVCAVLDSYKDLSQMSFMRQPWYPNEVAAGGVVEALEEQGAKVFNQKATAGKPWVRHNAFWTANPNVFPRWVADREWPDAPWCEMKFSQALRYDKKVSGIWGHRSNWVCVEHIGEVRNGIEY